MCLAVPGQIISLLGGDDPLMRQGRVEFAGIGKIVSLACLPEAEVGDYVVVHAGIALAILDPDEALASLQTFDQWNDFDAGS